MDEVMQISEELKEKKTSNDARQNGKLLSKEMDAEIKELNEQSKRMQQLIEQIDELPDSATKELMQECVNEMLTFYGNGLERIMNILMNEGNGAATKILNDLMEDNFISGLLIIHDLHPLDLQTRLNLALEKVRPYIHSHGGSVEIIELKDGKAKIRMSGSCKSCASSSVTLELAIKQAIEESCPDLLQLDVEGIEHSKNGHDHNIKAENISSPGWKQVSGVNDLSNGEMKFIDLNGAQLVICKVNDQLYAYKNNCPACDMPLSTGKIEDGIISCRLGHRYDIKHAGVCVDDKDIHLDPFPLLKENGAVKVSVG